MNARFRSVWMTALLGITILTTGSPRSARSVESKSDLDEFMASLVGGWAGENNTTPIGPIPFALLFERDPDGSLHAHSAMNRETYIDLRFHRGEDGRWMLTEEGAMEGLGTQTYTLSPDETGPRPGGLWRWSSAGDPRFLVVDLGIERDVLSMNVVLRGEDHARFELAKLPKEELPELARQLRLRAAQPPESAGESRTPAPASAIEEARDAVAANPVDAGAHLALAKALGVAIQEDQATNGPLYAIEMRESLRRTIELDPHRVEAYHHLVGYYLNAPAIVGGSIESAEQLARRLAEFDPGSGRELLLQVEASRAAKE